MFIYYLEVDQHPANGTFCEGTDATLNCTIFDNSTSDVADTTGWVNSTTGGAVPSEMVSNSRDGDMVTSILTILNVPLYINNTNYFCRPSLTEQSSVAVIIVIGKEHIQRHMYVCI